MCKHNFIKFNDVKVCTKCGITCTNGRLFFDKKLLTILSRKGKKKK